MLEALYLISALLLLLFLQRRLHREVQAIFLLLTRRPDMSLLLFSALFFPGVLLHEASHWLMAQLLQVRTGRFSLLPRPLPDGKLQMGYVETAQADPLRETLIGAAPLISGGAFTAYAGLVNLGLHQLWTAAWAQSLDGILRSIPQLIQRPDFWLWLYLTLVVSSTMLPSSSDRRGWLAVAIVLAAVGVVGGVIGAGPWLKQTLAPAVERILQAAAVVFAVSDLVHAVLLPPLWVARRWLMRLTGLQVMI